MWLRNGNWWNDSKADFQEVLEVVEVSLTLFCWTILTSERVLWNQYATDKIEQLTHCPMGIDLLLAMCLETNKHHRVTIKLLSFILKVQKGQPRIDKKRECYKQIIEKDSS